MIRLANRRLCVEIAEPGTLYWGPRFDWTGFIVQVTLDGTHTFCGIDDPPAAPGMGGAGLCNEFGILETPGFDEARPGEPFLKIGVGLLTRPDDKAYSFATPYALQRAPIQFQQLGEDRLDCSMGPVQCRGYAVALRKTVRLQNNQLHLDYELQNVGRRAIHVNEYRHNFLTIGGQPPGPEMSLQLSFHPEPQDVCDAFQVEQTRICWPRVPQDRFYSRFSGFHGRQGYWWQLVHQPSGVGIRESGQFPLSAFALWGTSQVLSPEAFIDLDVPAGGQRQWSRQYTFFDSVSSKEYSHGLV